jgi:hypothetical protein
MAGLTRPCLSKEIPWLVLLGELDGMEATDCLDRTWFSRRFIENWEGSGEDGTLRRERMNEGGVC